MTDMEWDEVGYIISSRYRLSVLKRLIEGPATPSVIADNMDMSIAHISRGLSELRDHGLVTLLVSEEQKKGRVYDITEKGQTNSQSVPDNTIDESGTKTETRFEDM